MKKSFTYTHNFTPLALEEMGVERAEKIDEIMLKGLIQMIARDPELTIETGSAYDPETNQVRIVYQTTVALIVEDETVDKRPSMHPVPHRPKRQEVKSITFDHLGAAVDVVDHLLKVIEAFGSVTRADYYNEIGIQCQIEDYTHGWRSLKDMWIRRHIHDGISKFELHLPPPVELIFK